MSGVSTFNIDKYIYMNTHIHIYIYTNTHTHTLIHNPTYIYIRTCAYIYTQENINSTFIDTFIIVFNSAYAM